jgi:NAD(P)-dependent dehydrogenase (short-subunit alcohol dehydrogenase family)
MTEGVQAVIAKMAGNGGKSTAQVEDEFVRTVRPTSLNQRLAKVEEVAAMAAYLCSELASATNGAPVRVDGGVVKSAY